MINKKLKLKINKNIIVFLVSVLFLHCSKNVLMINDSSLNVYGNTSTLNLLTWNIENFPKNNLTVEYLNNTIDSLIVDIIVLQEIKSATKLNQLTDDLGDEWINFRAYGSSNYGQLAYLINTNEITNITAPFVIDDESVECESYMENIDSHPCQNSDYYDISYNFAWRLPYILEFTYQNQVFYIINVHFKCCNINGNEKFRRYEAANYLNDYINNNYPNNNVIIMGDFNGNIDETVNIGQTYDVFESLLSTSYLFADQNIYSGDSESWSYPSYNSHIDHIVISNEIFNSPIIEYSTSTVLIENLFEGGFLEYNEYISDHRPVLINLNIEPF